MKIILSAITAALILICLGLFKAIYVFRKVKEESEFYLYKIEREIEENPNDPIRYCRRGSIYLIIQNFPLANYDFNHALELINAGFPVKENIDELKSIISNNIQYASKPLPWSNGKVKNLTNSGITYFLIKEFGRSRMSFFEFPNRQSTLLGTLWDDIRGRVLPGG